jgi:hypothetical protein
MSAAISDRMNDPRPLPAPLATLEPVRFGEFLLHRNLITDDQWLCALAEHWSADGARKMPIGSTIVANGFLARDVVEQEARMFHEDIEVVEVIPRSERSTMPIPNVPVGRA